MSIIGEIKHHPHALGLIRFLAQAIHDYKRRHRGLSPRRIVLHPDVYVELRGLATLGGVVWVHPPGIDELPVLHIMNVPVVENPDAEDAYLITHEGLPALI